MDNSLLIAARSEYTEQLQDILQESIYDGIKKTWETCKIEEGKTPLKCFQNRLCLIPEWNQEVINTYYKKILKNSELSDEYLDKIIEAVFLSNIKILSVVKLHNKKQVININVPDTKNFVHRCFIESARQFYSDPHLIDDRAHTSPEVARNIKRSYRIIRDSIEKTIRSMIPMEEILNKYLDSHEEEIVKSNSDGSLSDHNQEFVNHQDITTEDITTEDITTEDIPGPIIDPMLDNPDDIFESKPDIFASDPDETTQETGKEEPKLHIDLNNPGTDNSSETHKEENFFSDCDSD